MNGIVEMEDFSEDYKLIEEKLAILEKEKLDILDLNNETFSPHELMADRDIEREKMIRLDILRPLLKTTWESKIKDEKQEFISKFIENIVLIKNENKELEIEKINYRKGFIEQLSKFYYAGIFQPLMSAKIDDKEECFPVCVMNNDELEKYLKRMNNYFETSFYEMYQNKESTTGNITYEYEPDINEKIIKFVALRNRKPFSSNEYDEKIGFISYKKNQPFFNEV